MPSSDPAAPSAPSSPSGRPLRGFAWGLSLTLGLAILAYSALAVAVDPMDAGPGNVWCGSGIKANIRLGPKLLVARRTAPATIILGNSRVDNAFDSATLAVLGPAPRANLATADAQPAEMAALAREALAGGQLQRAYIGVDLSHAVSLRDSGAVRAIADTPLPWLETMRRSWLGSDVFSALGSVPPDCTVTLNPDGTATEARLASLPRPGASADRIAKARNDYSERMADLNRSGGARPRARLEQVRAIVRELRQGGVDVVLFAAPVHTRMDQIQREVGLGPTLAAWHRDLALMAQQEGAQFIDLRDQRAALAAGAPACPDGGLDCHYRDITHYSAQVGAALALPLVQAAEAAGD